MVAEWNASSGLEGDGPYADMAEWQPTEGTNVIVLRDQLDVPGEELTRVDAQGPGGLKMESIPQALRKPKLTWAGQLGPVFEAMTSASGSFTLEMWVAPGWKSNPTANVEFFEMGGSASGVSVTQEAHTDTIRFALGGSEGGSATADATLPTESYDGNLHQLVFTWDAAAQAPAIYFDGSPLESTDAVNGPIDWQGTDKGGIFGTAGYHGAEELGHKAIGGRGDIGLVRFSDNALSAEEVASRFKEISGK